MPILGMLGAFLAEMPPLPTRRSTKFAMKPMMVVPIAMPMIRKATPISTWISRSWALPMAVLARLDTMAAWVRSTAAAASMSGACPVAMAMARSLLAWMVWLAIAVSYA